MRRLEKKAEFYGLAMCACIGLAAAALGARSLWAISDSFEAGDIFYDEGPDLFQAWLRREHQREALTPSLISRRLLIMPIVSRRATVAAMMRPDFLSPVIDDEAARREVILKLEDGIVEALGTAPSAGDLWFAASLIRSRIVGFDRVAEDYLAASYLTAPREGDLARLRYVYLSQVAPLLRAPMTVERDRDRAIVANVYPAFEKIYVKWQRSREEGSSDASR